VVGLAGPRIGLPTTVWSGGPRPGALGPSSLVLALSGSGDTAETVAAATDARQAGATVVVVTAGGRLAADASAAGQPWLALPAGPPERALLGALTVVPLVALESLGLLTGIGAEVRRAADELARHRDALVRPDGLPAVMTRRIGRTFPLIHGAEGPGAVAARRWKAQINENAKSPAFSASLTDVGHSEVAGWGQDGDVTRQVFTLVRLRLSDEPAAVARTFAAVAEQMDEVVGDMIDVDALGEGPLAQFFWLVLVGDLVSLLMAGREGIDPGPGPAVDAVLGAGTA
jgi:glucose/mannose-6-phosphate isomerase